MNKKPFVTLEQLEEITKTYPTPFYLYDEKGIRENAKALKEAFSWNPGYKEYFAVKATPNPFLINILREYGCGCDCSSMTELMLSHEIGVTGEDIMFSSNDTPHRLYSGDHQLPVQPGRNLPDQQRYHGQPRGRQVRHDGGAAF